MYVLTIISYLVPSILPLVMMKVPRPIDEKWLVQVDPEIPELEFNLD